MSVAFLVLMLAAAPLPAIQSVQPGDGQHHGPRWVEAPSPSDYDRLYPHRARLAGVDGHVVMQCEITADGHMTNCTVVSETPKGQGFGEVTLKLAPKFRMADDTPGHSMAGAHMQIPVRWKLAR